MGAGTLAVYGRRADYYRFYEINPLVLSVARSEFSFLQDCEADVEIALGDARLSLEREASQRFDVLAVDAFSGDSIPVHLLTKEAFSIYLRHLKPGGILGIHVSNRYLDLTAIVQQAAQALNMAGRFVDTEDDAQEIAYGSSWVLLSDSAAVFSGDEWRTAQPLHPKKQVRLWTDDYSSLFSILQ